MRLIKLCLYLLISVALTISYQHAYAAKRSKSSRNSSKTASVGDVWQRVRGGLRIPALGATYHGIDALAAIAASPRRKLAAVNEGDKTKTTSTNSQPQDDSTRLTTTITPKKLLGTESQLLEKFRPKQQLASPKSSLYKKDIGQNRYTELGRKRLGQKLTQTEETGSSPEQASSAHAKTSKSPVIERLRTRLNFHPELAKHSVGGANIVTTPIGNVLGANGQNQQLTFVGRCADLAARETLVQAQQGLLPESYRILLDQCRQKRSAIYERINQQIAGFSSHVGFVNDSTERARPYIYHVVDALAKYGLPMDLALLPIVESGYKATALSPASAAGIWQFIPSTGRVYGLEQNEYYDGRLDVTSATHAAIRFLSGLKDHYRGDWLLALAAYNCGPGNVDAAIAKNLAAGLDTDYWSLTLPQETQNYVPRLLALSTMFANPGRYGVRLRPVKNQLYFIKVDIAHALDIHHLGNKELPEIAKLANFGVEEFGLLNTAYIKSIINKQEPFSLLMPIANANQLHQSLVYLAKTENERKAAYEDDFFLVAEDDKPSQHSFWPKIQQPLLAIVLEENQSAQPIRQFGKTYSEDKENLVDTSVWPKDYSAVHYLDVGETLKSVADSYAISETELKTINKFKRRQKAVLGQRLFIPIEQFASNSQQNHKSILFKAQNAASKG